MTERIRGNITLRFDFCSKLQNFGADRFLDLFHSVGGEILRMGTDETHSDPRQLISSGGDIMLAAVRHELLSAHTANVVTMGFLAATDFVTFAKDISHPETNKVESVARSFLDFALRLYPSLAPAYGLIDETGSNMPTLEDTQARKITHIFWANFFGRPYVEEYGLEFLQGAPGWKTETLSDGGVLYVVSPSFVNRWKMVKARQVREYFRQKTPSVRIYHPYKDQFLS